VALFSSERVRVAQAERVNAAAAAIARLDAVSLTGSSGSTGSGHSGVYFSGPGRRWRLKLPDEDTAAVSITTTGL
jgi:hypothetical protein